MSTRKRLLVITYHHPPDGAIGGMRWAGFTRHLARLGWASRVITAAPPESPRYPGVTTVCLPRRKTLNDFYKGFRLRGAIAAGNGRNGAGNDGHPAAETGAWTQARFELGMLLALPDDGRGWITRAARRARQEIKRCQPDVVVSSGPPHSAHVVAWLASRGTGARWLADFRDPWAGTLGGAWRSSALQRSGLARFVLPRLERLVIGATDGVLCNTREFAAALASRYPDARIDWIPNGVDEDVLPGGEAAPLPGLSLAHVGTLYGGRTLEPVLAALRLFLDEHPQARGDGSRLRLAGQVERAYIARLPEQVEAYGLAPHVERLGVIPRAEALQLARASRLALVLAQDQDLQVPAKLYELVGMGIPTLVIAGEQSAASSEARRFGVRAISPHDVAAIARVFADAWRGRFPSPDPTAGMLYYSDLSHTLDAILRGQEHNSQESIAKREESSHNAT